MPFFSALLLRIRLFKYSHGFSFLSCFIRENSLLTVGKECLSKGDVVIDIGANNGGSSLLFSALVGKRGFVFAFEPNPLVAQQLLKYEKLNFYKNIIVYLYGLGSINSIKKFFIDKRAGSQASTFDTLHQKSEILNNKASYDEIDVEVKKLDSFSFNRINFIKIDVEGFELEVLHGAINSIQKFKPSIYFECFFNDNIFELLEKKKSISNFFKQLDYRLDIVECFTDHGFAPLKNVELPNITFSKNTGCELLATPN